MNLIGLFGQAPCAQAAGVPSRPGMPQRKSNQTARIVAIVGLVALFLLGVGWNFLFTGSTTLSMTTYRPEERDRAQAALNFFVMATLAVSSLTSGVLVTTQGWTLLNYGSLIPVAAVAAALLWLAAKNSRPATA